MRKVVDAIVAEDNLREEVSMLKNRVRDLEAQNAALSSSPAKGRDEGYCTMSSGQPQPLGSHLEDLPEEPEQLLMMAEPTSADMEDWSMSQEELGAGLEEYTNEPDWLWQSSSYLNSTVDSQSESISKLLQTTVSLNIFSMFAYVHKSPQSYMRYAAHRQNIIQYLFWHEFRI